MCVKAWHIVSLNPLVLQHPSFHTFGKYKSSTRNKHWDLIRHNSVFINNEAAGLFGIIENYKNPWAKNEFANGDDDYPGYSRGNLYQGHLGEPPKTFSDLSYLGDNVTAYDAGQYKIKEDPSEGKPDYAPLMDLTRFIAHAPTNTSNAVEEWNKHFDMESVLRR